MIKLADFYIGDYINEMEITPPLECFYNVDSLIDWIIENYDKTIMRNYFEHEQKIVETVIKLRELNRPLLHQKFVSLFISNETNKLFYDNLSSYIVENNITLKKYLGHGVSGIAFEMMNGKVLKITESIEESLMANALINISGPFAKIYSVTSKSFSIIILEKLLITPDDFQFFYTMLRAFYLNKITLDNYNNPETIALFQTNKELKFMYEYFEILKYFSPYVEDVNNLDINYGNLGYDNNGNLKAFDVLMGTN